jgi:preprotein translocase subunit SecD
MLDFPKWKIWLIGIVIAIGVVLSIPSLIAGTAYGAMWPKWLPQYKINLGLDLAGGSHLLLEADAQDALKQRLQAKEDEVATELRRDPKIDVGDISTAGGRLSFLVRDPTQVDATVERMRKLSAPLQLTGNRDCHGRCSRRGAAAHRPRRHQGNHGRHGRRQPDPRRSARSRGP